MYVHVYKCIQCVYVCMLFNTSLYVRIISLIGVLIGFNKYKKRRIHNTVNLLTGKADVAPGEQTVSDIHAKGGRMVVYKYREDGGSMH